MAIKSINQRMSNTGKGKLIVSPREGESGCAGCTEYLWSDRKAYFINEVSEDGKEIVIERPKIQYVGQWPSYIKNIFLRDENPEVLTLRFRYGSWWVRGDDGKYITKMNLGFNGMSEYRDPCF